MQLIPSLINDNGLMQAGGNHFLREGYMRCKAKVGLVLTGVLMIAPAFSGEPVNGGSVNFTGTVVNAPCILAGDSVDMTVPLGQTTVNYLKQYTNAKLVNINIHLTNCALSGAGAEGADITKAHVRFDSSAVETDDSMILANTVSSGAQGVGVEVLTSDGQVIHFGGNGTPDMALQVTSSEQTLTFQSRMVNIVAIDGGETDITPGQVAANATYVISYQ
ncbi:type 1 fimbrial protein [Salmonella enterica]|nr:type 1 fimbrial protein [Salmonella enterica]EBW1593800.1 type 1 fimbrial protein [Salmonella enterica subsp. diarizonae serovar 61:r:z]EDR7608467.1 type 1 fimbrial protein [Salmonella enterica subsp. diarizonae]EAT8026998.1 type 1 fimbrial protein [Salmonella enterica]EBB6124941.1 type 1 fimbrial protein [Salmonella enterica]